MGKFLEAIKKHDWSYQFSEDPIVWRDGNKSLDVVKVIHKELKCPFTIGYPEGQIPSWLNNMVLEDFVEVGSGKFFRNGNVKKYVAPTYRSELITRKEFDEISQWIENNDV